MGIIRRKICREDFISRDEKDYGEINEPYFYINFSLTHNIDDIGLYTDFPFIEKIISGVIEETLIQGLRPNYDISAWYKSGDMVTTITDSKINDLRGYKKENQFKVGFDMDKTRYFDFVGREINGVTRIYEKGSWGVKYVVDAHNDEKLGTANQTTGLRYFDDLNKTNVTFRAQGVNETNSSLNAIVKEEYLMGIISTPEIKNDVFIDRGQNTVLEYHLRMSEIETLDHLVNYGNGYFNVTK